MSKRLKRLRNAGQQGNYKPSQPELPEDSHSDNVPEDSDSTESARSALKHYDWHGEYEELCQRFNWRIAAYIAWMSSPRRLRKPKTQNDLAQAIGLKSDRMFTKWREAQPEIDAEVKKIQASPLLAYRRDIYDALVAGALDAEKGHQDRKLALELMGDYRAKADNSPQLGFEFTADEAAEAEKAVEQWQREVQSNQSAPNG
jgi:hypothetical protein